MIDPTACRFFIGYAGGKQTLPDGTIISALCERPGCGKTWDQHYGDPPEKHSKKKLKDVH